MQKVQLFHVSYVVPSQLQYTSPFVSRRSRDIIPHHVLEFQFNSIRKYKNTAAVRNSYVQLYLELHFSQRLGNT